MIEQRRAQFLSLLEIDQYVPRRILQAGPKPVLLEAIEEGYPDQAVVANSNQSASSLPEDNLPSRAEQGEPAAHISELLEPQENLNRENANERVSKEIESENEIEPENKDSQEPGKHGASIQHATQHATQPLNFVLTVWRIRDQLMVIDSREPGTAYPTDRLLQNILRAMGHSLAQLPSSETVRWPIFTHQNAKKPSPDEENQQALAMVQAYMSAQLSKQPVKAIVCMGENAARFCVESTLKDEKQHGQLERVQIDAVGELPVAVTPSLHNLLQDPTLKAQVWKTLQALLSLY